MAGMTKNPASASEPEFAPATDPFALFEQWFADASAAELNDPNALALATVDATGMPNVRMVLLKGLDAASTAGRGFVFYTNFEGTKGRELLAHAKAAMVFHWKSLERQVRIRGPVTVVSNTEADAYFASRPRDSQIGAWASQQSRPIESRSELEAEVANFTAKFATGGIPRPPYWSGFRLVPVEIEFWRSRPFRLHDRAVFSRVPATGAWAVTRLFP
jgi:pyridoxamine 5'-phosphate oxidase